LFFVLPFSEEIGLFGGLSMDVPSEPLMLALTACVLGALLLGTGSACHAASWLHPIIVIPGPHAAVDAVDAVFPSTP
jgi:O-antigen ligase